uniref:WAP domain-containing protein n=1 Tax=Panagrellus redivivus TaxID=6233 RepID=A0A7E4V1W0_PANRE
MKKLFSLLCLCAVVAAYLERQYDDDDLYSEANGLLNPFVADEYGYQDQLYGDEDGYVGDYDYEDNGFENRMLKPKQRFGPSGPSGGKRPPRVKPPRGGTPQGGSGNRQPSGPGGNRQPSGPGGNRQPSGSGGNRQPSGSGGNRQPSGPGGNRQPSGPGGNRQPSGPGGNRQPSGPGGNRPGGGRPNSPRPPPTRVPQPPPTKVTRPPEVDIQALKTCQESLWSRLDPRKLCRKGCLYECAQELLPKGGHCDQCDERCCSYNCRGSDCIPFEAATKLLDLATAIGNLFTGGTTTNGYDQDYPSTEAPSVPGPEAPAEQGEETEEPPTEENAEGETAVDQGQEPDETGELNPEATTKASADSQETIQLEADYVPYPQPSFDISGFSDGEELQGDYVPYPQPTFDTNF